MDRFRERIDNNPAEFLKVISFYSEHKIFSLEGEKYKRILDRTKPEEIQEWYQRRNFYLTCNKNIDNILLSTKLIDELIFGFELLAPLYNYLI